MLRSFAFIVLVICLGGCQVGGGGTVATATSVPRPTELPRWVVYERALAMAIVRTEEALCEWSVLGEAEGKVFVYALCKVRAAIGTAGSVPVVIYLGEDGVIEKVVLPRDGNYYGDDLRAMFPDGVYERVRSFDTSGFTSEKHLDGRLRSGGPPLVVLAGTPMP